MTIHDSAPDRKITNIKRVVVTGDPTLIKEGEMVTVPEISEEMLQTSTLEIREAANASTPQLIIRLQDLPVRRSSNNEQTLLEILNYAVTTDKFKVIKINPDQSCRIRIIFGDQIIFLDHVHSSQFRKFEETKEMQSSELPPGTRVKIIDPEATKLFVEKRTAQGDQILEGDLLENKLSLASESNGVYFQVLHSDDDGNVYLTFKDPTLKNLVSIKTSRKNVIADLSYL